MKAIAGAALWLSAALLACSSNPPPPPPIGTGGAAPDAGHGGHGGHGGEVAEQPDSGPACSMNGGQTCVTAKDCPPSVGCDFCFTCDALPNGGRACRWHPVDAGVCDPL